LFLHELSSEYQMILLVPLFMEILGFRHLIFLT